MVVMKVGKCPTDELSLTNRVIINGNDHNSAFRGSSHIQISTGPGSKFLLTVEVDNSVPSGYLGFSLPQRKWAVLSLNQELDVLPHRYDETRDYIGAMVLHVDFFNKKKVTQEPFDSDAMAKEFLMQFSKQSFTVGQPIVFQFQKKPLLQIVVSEIETSDLSAIQQGKDSKMVKASCGMSFANTQITFEKGEGSSVFLTGKSKGKVQRQSIINPDWDFSKMGIGGLDTQFNAIFRRAFASRVFPPEIMEQLGCKHVKGKVYTDLSFYKTPLFQIYSDVAGQVVQFSV